MADNILKRIWNFVFRKKTLSEEDMLIISELKDMYVNKNKEEREKELSALLSKRNQTALTPESIPLSVDEEPSETDIEIMEEMFECKHIWDDFEAVRDYLNRLMAGADFVSGSRDDLLRKIAEQEAHLTKIEMDFEDLRKDKFIEKQECEAVNSRLEELRKLIEENKNKLDQEFSKQMSARKQEIVSENYDEKDQSAADSKVLDQEVDETVTSFEKELMNLVEQHNLGLSPEEVKDLINTIKKEQLKRLFEEKIKAINDGENKFKREFNDMDFNNTPVVNPYAILRNFTTEQESSVSREELLQKLGLFLSHDIVQASLNKLIAPHITLMQNKSHDILERRRKQYQKSIDKFKLQQVKRKEPISIPKALAGPVAHVLKKHMALSIKRESKFLRAHTNKFKDDAYSVIINGKKQVLDEQYRNLKKESVVQNGKEKKSQPNTKEVKQKTLQLQKKQQERKQYLQHLRELSQLEAKKALYYSVRQKLQSANKTKQILMENKIDNTEKHIHQVQESIKKYEQKKKEYRQQAQEVIAREEKHMAQNVIQQRQLRQQMRKEYKEKLLKMEQERNARFEKMKQMRYTQQQQEVKQAQEAKKQIDSIRQQEYQKNKNIHSESVTTNAFVGSRFSHKMSDNQGPEKEYHRDFSQYRKDSNQGGEQAQYHFKIKKKQEDSQNNTGDFLKQYRTKNNQVNEGVSNISKEVSDGVVLQNQQTGTNIEPNILETEKELEQALTQKAKNMREKVIADNKKKEKEAQFFTKIEESKKDFQETVNRQKEHQEDVLHELADKKEHVKNVIEEKKKEEELRMQEIKNMREAVLEKKQETQKKNQEKQKIESEQRRQNMLEEQKKKREEVKQKMEEDRKRREELRQKMEEDKRKRAQELQKKKEEEAKKKEELRKKREEEKKKRAEELKKKKEEEARRKEEIKRKAEDEKKKLREEQQKKKLEEDRLKAETQRKKAEALQKKQIEDRKRQLAEKEKQDKLRREQMLKEQEEKRQKAREAMEKNKNI